MLSPSPFAFKALKVKLDKIYNIVCLKLIFIGIS